MSMVGIRPESEVFIEELRKEIPYYHFRHTVKTGVTCLTQVKINTAPLLKTMFGSINLISTALNTRTGGWN